MASDVEVTRISIDTLLANEAEECRRAEEHYRAALFDEARHRLSTLPERDALRGPAEAARDALYYIYETSEDNHASNKALAAFREIDAALKGAEHHG